MNSNRIFLTRSALIIAMSFVILFTCYCFHFNADLTDEGFYLYSFQHGSKIITFNFYHFFLSPIGNLFDHCLLGYRYLSLIGILFSSVALVYSIKNEIDTLFYVIAVSLGLFYFNLISTFSYNTLVLIFSALVLGLKFFDFRKPCWIFQALIGLSCFLIFSARYGSGLLLLIQIFVINFLTMYRDHFIKSLFINLVFFVFPMLISYFFWEHGFKEMSAVLTVLSRSSHDNLLGSYFTQFSRFFLRSFFPPLLLLYLGNNFFLKQRKVLFFLYLAWFVVVHIFQEYEFTNLGYYFSGAMMALSFYEFRLNYDKDKKSRFFLYLVFPISVYLSSCLGTNNNLFKFCSYNALLLFPVINYFILHNDYLRKSWVAVFCTFLALYGVYQNQYIKSYRSDPRDKQSFVKSRFESLRGIYIDRNMEEKLLSIQQKLIKLRAGESRFFSYPDLPGIPAYLGLKTLGSSWNVSKYANADLSNCTFIELEDRVEKVFIYTEKKIPNMLLNCIKAKADQLVFI